MNPEGPRQGVRAGLWDWNVVTGEFHLDPDLKAILGYRDDEIPDDLDVWSSYIHPEDRKAVMEAARAHLEGRTPEYAAEHRMVHKDGSIRWIRAQGKAVRDESGRAIRMIGVDVDITEQKEALESLRANEEKYRAVVEQSADCIFLVDVESRRIIEANGALAELLGYRRDELLRMTLYDFIHHPDEDIDVQIERILTETTSALGERTYRRKDDSLVPMEVRVGLILYGGKRVFCVVSRDVSERKRIEEEKRRLDRELRQAQKMEALGTLAGGIAHDFNNILSVIMGNAQIGIMEMREGRGAEEELDSILRAGLRARDLVKRILEYSRGERGEKQNTSLGEVVREAVEMVRASVPGNVRIRSRLLAERDVVWGHPTEIHRVVMNLCTNGALAMTERGGDLEVSLRELDGAYEVVRSTGLGPGRFLELAVRDSGDGIDPAIRDRIFDPFFTTRQPGRGVGLGLSEAYRIVQDHDGTIFAENGAEGGAVFRVILPLREAEPGRAPTAGDTPIGRGERVLLVDDEGLVLRQCGRMLESLGYRVTSHTSADEARRDFESSPHAFDLLITDQVMPGTTGDALIGQLRRVRADLPVLLCTGFNEKASPEWAARNEVQGVLVKPFLMADLARMVRGALHDGEPGAPPAAG